MYARFWFGRSDRSAQGLAALQAVRFVDVADLVHVRHQDHAGIVPVQRGQDQLIGPLQAVEHQIAVGLAAGQEHRLLAGHFPLPVVEAEEIVKQAIANLKGYTITSTEEVQVRRGTAYKVNVKDSAGNQLYYFVNPFGFARGPLSDLVQNN